MEQSSSALDKQRLLELLRPAHKAIEPTKGSDVVLVLGNTGSGKSSLVAKLTGCSLISIGSGDMARVAIDPVAPIRHAPRIADGDQSCTLYPEVYSSQLEDFPELFFMDAPGFEDTRGKEAKICASVSIQMAIKLARQIRAVLVVVSLQELIAARGEMMRRLLNTLQALLRDPDQAGKSIWFVFTKESHDLLSKPAERLQIQQDIYRQLSELQKKTGTSIKKKNKTIQRLINSAARPVIDFLGRFLWDTEASQQKRRQKLDDLYARKTILDLMMRQIASPQHVILADVLDDGETRRMIHQLIVRTPPLPKNMFVFSSHGELHLSFRELIFNLAQEGSMVIRDLLELPPRIKHFTEERHHAIERIATYTRILEEDASSQGQDTLIEESQKDIQKAAAIVTRIQRRIGFLEAELKSIDHDEPVIYVSFRPPEYSRLRRWYDVFGFTKIPVDYRDIPFVSINQAGIAGRFKHSLENLPPAEYDPIHGVYQNTFFPNWKERGEVYVDILVRSKDRPDNIKRKADIERELLQLKQELQLAKQQSDNEQRRIQDLESGKREAESMQSRMEATIARDQQQLESAKRFFERQKDYYAMVDQMASVVDFESALITAFRELYQRYTDGESIELDVENIEALLDPVLLTLMRDPVMTKCGHSYDRVSLEKLFGDAHEAVCAVCTTALVKGEEQPNRALKDVIEAFEKFRLQELNRAVVLPPVKRSGSTRTDDVDEERKLSPQQQFENELLKTVDEWHLGMGMTTSGEEAGQDAEVALSQVAAQFGFKCVNIEKSGNCFFHAVAGQLNRLTQSEFTSQEVMARTVEHMVRNIALYRGDTEGDREAYYLKLAKREYWGEGEEIVKALSRALNVTLVIVRSDGQPPVIIKQESAVIIYLGYGVGAQYQSLILDSAIERPPLNIMEMIQAAEYDRHGEEGASAAAEGAPAAAAETPSGFQALLAHERAVDGLAPTPGDFKSLLREQSAADAAGEAAGAAAGFDLGSVELRPQRGQEGASSGAITTTFMAALRARKLAAPLYGEEVSETSSATLSHSGASAAGI